VQVGPRRVLRVEKRRFGDRCGPEKTGFLSGPHISDGHTAVRIGHINLAASMDAASEAFASLVKTLRATGIDQYVLVQCPALATRLADLDGVSVGPAVRSPLLAYCMLPQVDVAHVHEVTAGQAGLLLALARSTPYVLTHRGEITARATPLMQAIYRRASVVICQDDAEVAMLRHWAPGLRTEIAADIDSASAAAIHLRVYQNSQRMPIAGSSGIQ